MSKTVKKILLTLSMFIMLASAMFVFNQTMQIIQSARDVNTAFGTGVMWALIFTYVGIRTRISARPDQAA